MSDLKIIKKERSWKPWLEKIIFESLQNKSLRMYDSKDQITKIYKIKQGEIISTYLPVSDVEIGDEKAFKEVFVQSPKSFSWDIA